MPIRRTSFSGHLQLVVVSWIAYVFVLDPHVQVPMPTVLVPNCGDVIICNVYSLICALRAQNGRECMNPHVANSGALCRPEEVQ